MDIRSIVLKCKECTKEYITTKYTYEKNMVKFGIQLCHSCSRKGERNPFYGRRFSEEKKEEFADIRRAYYNDSKLGDKRRQEQRERYSGEGNPMYKGKDKVSNYTTRSKYPRMYALNRDNYTCVKCNETLEKHELVAHHLNSCNWDIDGRLDTDNIVTMCKPCHKTFHHVYKYGSNTKEQFDQFMLEGSETNESGQGPVSSVGPSGSKR